MAYTTVDQLTTLNPQNGEIENGGGFYIKDRTFFYAADIEKVIGQSRDAKISDLQIVKVIFERNEPVDFPKPNHERVEITGLALKKSQSEQTATGSFDNTKPGKSKWHDIVAIGWPPYYRSGSVTSLTDADNPQDEGKYNGRPFEGSLEYFPGQLLQKI